MQDSDKRAFLEKTFEGSLDAIIFTDEKGYIVEVNQAYVELTGYNKEEIIGKHTAEFSPMKEGAYECTTGELIQIDKKFSDHIKSSMDSFIEKGKLHNVMGYQLRKDGTIVPVEDNMVSLCDSTGEKIGAFAVIRDITARRKTLEELRANKEFLENIIQSSLDAIVVTDEHGCITKVNSAYCQLIGFSEADILGKNVAIFSSLKQGNYQCTTGELIQIDKEYIDKVIKYRFREFAEKNKLRDKKSFFLRKDNVLVPVEYSMTYLFGESGEKIGACAVIRDITKRKAEESKLINYQKRLKSLTSELIISEQKDRQYFSDFLHDEVGQQLFATRLQLEQLKNSLSSAENTKTLDKALNNLHQVMNQTRSLTSELSSPILKQLGLEKALEWLAEETHKRYDIMVSFEDDKQEKPLDDNVKFLLYQAVTELLTNVAKHAQTKNASVSIKKDNSNVRVCVEDKGVGFNSQNEDCSDGKIGGIGLFRITERLESFGGQLEIKSQPSHGTTVNLVVPLKGFEVA